MGKPGLNRLYAAYKPQQGRMQAAGAWLKPGASLPQGWVPAPGVVPKSGTREHNFRVLIYMK